MPIPNSQTKSIKRKKIKGSNLSGDYEPAIFGFVVLRDLLKCENLRI